MSGTDMRLRELLEIAASEPPGGVSVAEVRRLARRRRTRHTTVGTAAAAAACAAVSIAAAAASGPASGHPSASGPPAAGVPRYYVQEGSPAGNGFVVYRQAVVRDTATGAVTAPVSCPPGLVLSGRVAAAGDEGFFMACVLVSGSGRHEVILGSRIYRFEVRSRGTINGYALVPGGTLPGRGVEELTAAADGSAIAMWTFPKPLGGGGNPALLVINTSTGAHATWSAIPRTAVEDISLSPGGRELRFILGRSRSAGVDPQEYELAQVSPASQGGSLGSARVLVHVPTLPELTLISYADLSSDGSVLTVAEMSSPPQAGGRAEMVVEEISVQTGKVIRILFLAAFTPRSNYGSVASSDPSGRYVIVIYGNSAATRNGWLRLGHLVPLAPVAGTPGLYETW